MRLTVALIFLASLCAQAALAAPTLAGKWRIVAVTGAEGLDASKAQAEFSKNGRFASTVGCNRIAGKPAIAGDRLTFGQMMTTRMACIRPLDQVERSYLAALQDVRSYRLEGARLTFLGEDGAPLVTLDREQ